MTTTPASATATDVIVTRLGATLVIWLFAILTISTMVLGLGAKLGGWILPLATVAVAAGCAMYPGAARTRALLVLSFLFFLGASCGVAAWIIDPSYDGWAYHAAALIELARGWNPFFSDAAGSHSHYLNIYPKAAWILGASFFTATGLIESAKTINVVACLSSLCLLYSVFRAWHVSSRRAAGLSLLIALNPIVIVQVATLMVDGLLASVLTALAASLALAATRSTKAWLAIACMLVVVLVNLKTPAVFFAFCAGGIWLVARWRRNHAFGGTMVLGAAACLGVFVYGFAPFTRAAIQHHNPFYPVAGPGKVDVISGQYVTPEFGALPAWQKLSVSLASATATEFGPPRLKIPGTLRLSELRQLRDATRIGGFGPWFSLLLVLGAVLTLMLVFFDRSIRWILAGMSGALLATVLMHPAAWWARYVPQFYWVPLLGVIAFAARPDSLRLDRRVRALCVMVVIVATINSAFSFSHLARTAAQTRDYRRILRNLAGRHVTIEPGVHVKAAELLREHDVNVVVAPVPAGEPFGVLQRGRYKID